MADEMFLSSLSPGDSVRYKAFISSAFSPKDILALLNDQLPPVSLLDAKSHERLLLALCTAAKVFAIDLAEAAMELHTSDVGCAGQPLAPGHLQEAWRRMMLQGKVLGAGEAQQSPIKEAITITAAGVVRVAGSSSGSAAGGIEKIRS